MNPQRSLVVHGLLLLFLASAPAAAQTRAADATDCGATSPARPGRAIGLVVDPSGQVLPGAAVAIECGSTVARGFTGADGRFDLTVPAGAYTLRVTLAGFEMAARAVTVADDAAPITVTLRLASFVDNVRVVVTASSVETSLVDAPASISVVSREELDRKPVRDLTDVLARVEGVTLSHGGNLKTVQLRGLGSAYTLMLIDGRRVSSGSTLFRGNDFESAWLPIDAIERVEVVRGPMSSLYGSDAIGGVINVITKRVGARWTGSVVGDATLQQNREAGDGYQVGFNVGGPLVASRLGVKLYGSHNQRAADGRVNPSPANGAAPLPGFEKQRNSAVGGELAWTPDAARDVGVNWDYSDRAHGGFTLRRLSLGSSYRQRWTAAVLDAKVYADIIDNLVGNVSGASNPNQAINSTGEARVTRPWRRHTLTVGGELRHQRLDDPTTLAGLPGTLEYGHDTIESVLQGAAFAEDEIGLHRTLHLTLGGRVDGHETFGTHVTPRAYLVFRPVPLVTIKGGWSGAFRAPTLLQGSERWGSVSCGSATVGCFIVGSPALKPETSGSGEVGVQLTRESWRAGVTVFRNDLKDMIDITSRTANRQQAPSFPNFVGFLPDGRPIFAYQNVARVRTMGVESHVRVQLTRAIGVQANYTHLDATNRSGASPLPMPYQPSHSANVTADWLGSDRLAGYVTAQYVGRQYTLVPPTGVNPSVFSGFLTFDVGASYRLSPALTLRGGVLNAANRLIERNVVDDFNEDGRRFFLSFGARF
jgi:outer membrane receptor for ferrienterochelin and colicins